MMYDEKSNAAAVKIQSVHRGRSERRRLARARNGETGNQLVRQPEPETVGGQKAKISQPRPEGDRTAC